VYIDKISLGTEETTNMHMYTWNWGKTHIYQNGVSLFFFFITVLLKTVFCLINIQNKSQV